LQETATAEITQNFNIHMVFEHASAALISNSVDKNFSKKYLGGGNLHFYEKE
jgi:hypothetical protein